MRVYHFLKACYGLDGIRQQRLKIARIDELNDPFELIGYASRDHATRQAFLATKARLAERAGLLCFSRGWRNPVQWSHYADHHRGLCLGFDIPEKLMAPVSYVRRRPIPDLGALTGSSPIAEKAMLALLTTKFSHWRYEDEVRLFVSLDKLSDDTEHYFKDFDNDIVLREVIVGANSTLSRSDLNSALGSFAADVTLKKARLAFRSFRVVEQRQSKLWS